MYPSSVFWAGVGGISNLSSKIIIFTAFKIAAYRMSGRVCVIICITKLGYIIYLLDCTTRRFAL